MKDDRAALRPEKSRDESAQNRRARRPRGQEVGAGHWGVRRHGEGPGKGTVNVPSRKQALRPRRASGGEKGHQRQDVRARIPPSEPGGGGGGESPSPPNPQKVQPEGGPEVATHSGCGRRAGTGSSVWWGRNAGGLGERGGHEKPLDLAAVLPWT